MDILGLDGKVVARGAAGVGSVGGGLRLPHARHSQVQSAQTAPPQNTAEHISQADGTSMKTLEKQGIKTA